LSKTLNNEQITIEGKNCGGCELFHVVQHLTDKFTSRNVDRRKKFMFPEYKATIF